MSIAESQEDLHRKLLRQFTHKRSATETSNLHDNHSFLLRVPMVVAELLLRRDLCKPIQGHRHRAVGDVADAIGIIRAR